MIARRSLAGLLSTIALFLGSLAWTGFTMQRTVFDPSRTQEIASVLLDSSLVEHVLLQRVVSAADGAMPEELRARFTVDDLSGAAAEALGSDVVSAQIEQAAFDTHSYLIGAGDTPPTLDTSALDTTMRQQLATVRPDLAEALPQIEPITIELPTAGLSPLRASRRLTLSLTPTLAFIAAATALLALLISPERPRVLARFGIWAMTVGALWMLLRFVIPPAAESLLGDSGAFFAGLSEAFASTMTNAGLVMFLGGVTLFALSFLVGALERTATEDRGVRPYRRVDWSQAHAMRQRTNEAMSARRAARETGSASASTPASASASASASTTMRTTVDDAGTYRPPRPQRLGEPGRPSAAMPARPVVEPRQPAPPRMPRPPAATGNGGGVALPRGVDGAGGPGSGPRREFRDRRPTTAEDATAHQPGSPAQYDAENRMMGMPAPLGDDPLATPDGPRWVEGVGYVYPDPPTPDARWIDGLGWAIEER